MPFASVAIHSKRSNNYGLYCGLRAKISAKLRFPQSYCPCDAALWAFLLQISAKGPDWCAQSVGKLEKTSILMVRKHKNCRKTLHLGDLQVLLKKNGSWHMPC
jgi:hypothetical protein